MRTLDFLFSHYSTINKWVFLKLWYLQTRDSGKSLQGKKEVRKKQRAIPQGCNITRPEVQLNFPQTHDIVLNTPSHYIYSNIDNTNGINIEYYPYVVTFSSVF